MRIDGQHPAFGPSTSNTLGLSASGASDSGNRRTPSFRRSDARTIVVLLLMWLGWVLVHH
ncbi:MAG: hypothetical protein M3Y41_11375 [Pseudomonadota bacterium]|nr:hypothetical protein [Pseudomonadota bacterium]